MTVEFLLTALVLALLPGPGVIYVLATGVTQGARAAVLGAVGCVAGAAPYLAATLAGLGEHIASNAIVFEAIKWAGVAYLVFLGIRTWRDRREFELHSPIPRSAARLVGYGALLTLLNPKLPIFFYAFLPRFVASDRSDVVVLSLVFLALVGVIYSGYGTLAALASRRLLARAKSAGWARRVFASCYGLLAARLALQTL